MYLFSYVFIVGTSFVVVVHGDVLLFRLVDIQLTFIIVVVVVIVVDVHLGFHMRIQMSGEIQLGRRWLDDSV